MKDGLRAGGGVTATAERTMRGWAIAHEIQDRVDHAHAPQVAPTTVKPYVCITRLAGAGGSEIAASVGRKLGWTVLDKELLDRVAARYHEVRGMLDLVDETESNWVYDMLGIWMDQHIVPHEKLVAQLERVVSTAARQEPNVFVGRGAQFMLPPAAGVRVRLVASLGFRVARMMTLRGMDRSAATRYIRRVDRGRRELIQRFFRQDEQDPQIYDLVINTESFGMEGAADLIAHVVRQRLP